eukprot:TRINITY_DN5712_c0_g1_i1.p1 TRINITY_DN5712_c0_g1~~TRINITY_DN5712_c0_g1_i1.p1  ORF type:complete len:922 (-),score=115.08 TRINITY_DN5712_c0_g1_i1:137-2833(-)
MEQLLQLCFNEEEFKADDFDQVQFVIEKKRHIPLETLQKDLQKYFDYLQQEVVELINTDLYDNFLSVSNKLYGLDAELHNACDPLPEHLQRVGATIGKLTTKKAAVRAKLTELNHTEATRAFYVSLLKLHLMEKQTAEWLRRSTDEADDLDLLYRVSIECKQMQEDEKACIPTNAEQEDEKQQAVEVTRKLCDVHNTNLEVTLVNLLDQQQELIAQLSPTQDPTKQDEQQETRDVPTTQETEQALSVVGEKLKRVLECYKVLGSDELVATIFKKNTCDPIVDKVLSRQKTNDLRIKPEEKLLPTLLRSLLEKIETHCIPFVRLADQVDDSFMLMSKAVWVSAMNVIVSRMQIVFSPGNPDPYHHNYTSVHWLLEQLQKRTSTHQELVEWSQSKAMEEWNAKWRLSVYSTLRGQELQTALQEGLGGDTDSEVPTLHRLPPTSSPTTTATSQHLFTFTETKLLYERLHWLWSDGVYIYNITPTLLKQTVRVCVVLQKWVALLWQTTPGDSTPHKRDTSSPAKSQDTPSTDDAGVQVKVKDLSPKDLIALYCDMLAISQDLEGPLLQHICAKVECNTPKTPQAKTLQESISGVLSPHCTSFVKKALETIAERICKAVTALCMQPVTHVKTYPSAYRVQGKPVPVRFQAYVTSILTPLIKIRSSCGGDKDAVNYQAPMQGVQVPDDILQNWIQTILTDVTSSYSSFVMDVYSGAKKAEGAAQKMRNKSKAGLQKSENKVSATDKMFIQILLDFQRYGVELEEFGVSPDKFEPYKAQMALVADAVELQERVKQQEAEEARSRTAEAILDDTPAPSISPPPCVTPTTANENESPEKVATPQSPKTTSPKSQKSTTSPNTEKSTSKQGSSSPKSPKSPASPSSASSGGRDTPSPKQLSDSESKKD